MRVLFTGLFRYPTSRSTPIRLLREAEAVQELGGEVRVAGAFLDGSLRVPFVSLGVVEWDLRRRPYRLFHPRLWVRMVALLLVWRPHIVHAFLPATVALWMVPAKLAGARMVYEDHGDFIEWLESSRWVRRGSPPARLLRALDRLLHRWADLVVVLNRGYARELSRLAGARVVVVPGGVPPDLLGDATPDPEISRGGKPVVMYVGNLNPYQGIPVLIDAAREVLRRHDVEFVIAGSGPAERYRSGAPPGVRFLGPVEESRVPGLLRSASVLVAPTSASPVVRTAYMSKIPVYLSSGTAVVATNVNEEVAWTLQDGRNGLLVPPDNPAALAGAIGRLLENPSLRRELGERGRRFVEENLQWSRLCGTLVEAYKDLLGLSGKGPESGAPR